MTLNFLAALTRSNTQTSPIFRPFSLANFFQPTEIFLLSRWNPILLVPSRYIRIITGHFLLLPGTWSMNFSSFILARYSTKFVGIFYKKNMNNHVLFKTFHKRRTRNRWIISIKYLNFSIYNYKVFFLTIIFIKFVQITKSDD